MMAQTHADMTPPTYFAMSSDTAFARSSSKRGSASRLSLISRARVGLFQEIFMRGKRRARRNHVISPEGAQRLSAEGGSTRGAGVPANCGAGEQVGVGLGINRATRKRLNGLESHPA